MVFNLSGLDHGLPLEPEELAIANDFVAPALYFEKFRAAALDHLGGSPDRHDAALFNRLTGATYATHLTLVKPGDTVIGVSASYRHPSVHRAAAHAGARQPKNESAARPPGENASATSSTPPHPHVDGARAVVAFHATQQLDGVARVTA